MKSNHKPYKGFFLTVEGCDGCGKSSIAQAVIDRLKNDGVACIHTREPGGTPTAERIRFLLLHSDGEICPVSETLLFLASRAQHLHEKILPALHRGDVVVCERFNDSTLAYQAGARHLGMERIQKLCELACDGIEPHLTLLLDIDPETGFKRRVERTADRMEQEGLAFQKEVRQNYLYLADRFPERICVIDASRPLVMVIEEAWTILKKRIGRAIPSSSI